MDSEETGLHTFHAVVSGVLRGPIVGVVVPIIVNVHLQGEDLLMHNDLAAHRLEDGLPHRANIPLPDDNDLSQGHLLDIVLVQFQGLPPDDDHLPVRGHLLAVRTAPLHIQEHRPVTVGRVLVLHHVVTKLKTRLNKIILCNEPAQRKLPLRSVQLYPIPV